MLFSWLSQSSLDRLLYLFITLLDNKKCRKTKEHILSQKSETNLKILRTTITRVNILHESRSCFFFFNRFERSHLIVSPSRAPSSIILCWNEAGAPINGSVYFGSEMRQLVNELKKAVSYL